MDELDELLASIEITPLEAMINSVDMSVLEAMVDELRDATEEPPL